jgi:hypothetical protein
MTEAAFRLRLSGEEPLVLFEWLANIKASEATFADQAEQRVLCDIEPCLERHLVSPREPVIHRLAAVSLGRQDDPQRHVQQHLRTRQ